MSFLAMACTFFGRPQKIIQQKIPDKLVVLTFDDAAKSHFSFVAPLLKKYHFGATFYVCEFQPDFSDTTKYMQWSQIQALSKMGFEIGNHTWHHKHVNKTDSAGLVTELDYITRKCDSLQIKQPTSFAYPGYDTHLQAVKILQQQGFATARIGGDTIYNPLTDHPFYIPSFSTAGTDSAKVLNAIRQAKDGNIVVLTVHGVPDIAHDWVTTPPELFEMYLQYLQQHQYKVISMEGLLQYIDVKEAFKIPVPVKNKK